ncbi:hypothetical protein [Rhodococcus sp. NPDC003348]
MATVPTPTEARLAAGTSTASATEGSDWAFYAVVGTSVQGGHTLARFGPERTALGALRLAVQSVNHTAYSMLEQGVPGDPCADPRLLERLPITDFSIERRRPGSAEPDMTWGLTGGRHQRRRRAA